MRCDTKVKRNLENVPSDESVHAPFTLNYMHCSARQSWKFRTILHTTSGVDSSPKRYNAFLFP